MACGGEQSACRFAAKGFADVAGRFCAQLASVDPRVTSYQGIPFAAPPIGDNRWRTPQPVLDWAGVFQAHAFAPISMQASTVIDEKIYTREWSVDPDIPMPEDCNELNVWTPAKQANKKPPVYVWYFGGGLQVGYTAEMEFDGERIARRSIVVVTVNYRLNARSCCEKCAKKLITPCRELPKYNPVGSGCVLLKPKARCYPHRL